MNEALPPGEFAKALQRKRAVGRRRRYLVLGGIGGGLALILLVGYLLLFSSVFAAREVAVSGTNRVSADEVKAAAEVQVGTPLLRQDTTAIVSRVESLAPVRSAKVSFRWPSTVEIQVTERQAAYQRTTGEGYDLIDDEATVFAHSDKPFDGVLQATVEGDDKRLLTDVATVAKALPENLRGQVTSLQAKSVDRITLKLSKDRHVVWGSAEDSTLKAEVLAALLQVDAKVYDVSAPHNPTTRESAEP